MRAITLVVGLLLVAAACSSDDGGPARPAAPETPATGGTAPAPPPVYPLDAYDGLGTWIDVFDYSPRFAGDRGPQVTPRDVTRMADAGVDTIYLQAARHEHDVPGGIVDPERVGQFLSAAHARGMSVVAWYLPRRYDQDDLRRVEALRDFRAGDETFDGLALDLEFRGDVPDLGERNEALVEFSRRLRAALGDATIGAIVLSPVLLEVVNPEYWPAFPWRDLAGLYDVWLPMAYWTDRTADSRYRNAYVYTDETIRRLRANLGLARVPIHVIGGVGDRLTDVDVDAFVRAVAEHGASGASIYDFGTTGVDPLVHLREGLAP